MKKKKNLNLESIKVKSFVTTVNDDTLIIAKGGAVQTFPPQRYCVPTTSTEEIYS